MELPVFVLPNSFENILVQSKVKYVFFPDVDAHHSLKVHEYNRIVEVLVFEQNFVAAVPNSVLNIVNVEHRILIWLQVRAAVVVVTLDQKFVLFQPTFRVVCEFGQTQIQVD